MLSWELPAFVQWQLMYLFNKRNGGIQPRYHVWQGRSGADVETSINLTPANQNGSDDQE